MDDTCIVRIVKNLHTKNFHMVALQILLYRLADFHQQLFSKVGKTTFNSYFETSLCTQSKSLCRFLAGRSVKKAIIYIIVCVFHYHFSIPLLCLFHWLSYVQGKESEISV